MSDWSDDEVLQIVFLHRTLGYTGGQVAAVMGCTRNSVLSIVNRVAKSRDAVEARALSGDAIKRVLDLLFSGRMTASALAKTFDMTRLGILYLVWLVMNDLACAGPDETTGPETADRVCWPSWWRALPACEVAA